MSGKQEGNERERISERTWAKALFMSAGKTFFTRPYLWRGKLTAPREPHSFPPSARKKPKNNPTKKPRHRPRPTTFCFHKYPGELISFRKFYSFIISLTNSIIKKKKKVRVCSASSAAQTAQQLRQMLNWEGKAPGRFLLGGARP